MPDKVLHWPEKVAINLESRSNTLYSSKHTEVTHCTLVNTTSPFLLAKQYARVITSSEIRTVPSNSRYGA